VVLEKLTEIYNIYKNLLQTQPIIAGAFSLYGLGIITYVLKDIPIRVYRKIKHECFTELVVNSHDRVYDDVLEWIGKNKNHSFVRSLNLSNKNEYGYQTAYGAQVLSIGYNRVYFVYKNRIMFMDRVKESASATHTRKETMTITMLGRNKKILVDLVNEITKPKEEDNLYTTIKKYSDSNWTRLCKSFKRPLNTVIIDKEIKNKIINHIKNFQDSKNWYIKNGVPYRTGILLYGPPGTGKTSLIKALCAEFDSDLYLINSDNISQLKNALPEVPENCIVAVEDIDATDIGKTRLNTEGDFEEGVESVFKSNSLSGVLNAIDGVASGEGRILIATTNHIEKLDPALLREGRFDLKVEIGNMTTETFKEYMLNFYPDLNLDGVELKEEIAPCKLQQLVFENKDNPDRVLEQVTNTVLREIK
jgi:chaperone BCS1